MISAIRRTNAQAAVNALPVPRRIRISGIVKHETPGPHPALSTFYGPFRIDLLRAVPIAVRFLSIEPLLEDLGILDLTDIHWVIVGGESGARARPMSPEWVRHLRDQCRTARVPFFFKQWGGVRKAETGRKLDGVFWDQFPTKVSSRSPWIAARKHPRAAIAAWRDCDESRL